MKKLFAFCVLTLLFLLCSCSSINYNSNTSVTSNPEPTADPIVQANYQEALQNIEEGKYDEAKQLLSEVSKKDYESSKLLLENLEKLRILVENKWVNNDLGWTYISTFKVYVLGDSLILYNYEKEYSGDTYMGDYEDRVDLEDLLTNSKVYVRCSLRDNFVLNIENILDGEISRNNEWVHANYYISN